LQCSSDPDVAFEVENPDGGEWLDLTTLGEGLTPAEYSMRYGRLTRLAGTGRVRSRISVGDDVIATVTGPHALLDSAPDIDASGLEASPDVYMRPRHGAFIVACLSTRAVVHMSSPGASYLMAPDSAPEGVLSAFTALRLLAHAGASTALTTRTWLIRASRSTAEAANLKLFFAQDVRKRIARLLQRIEYDVDARESAAELRALCAREGVFADYLSDFITEICVHEEVVRAELADLLGNL